MKVKSVVTCLPVKSPQKSIDFYLNCLEFSSTIEENIVTVEVANLSLFLIEENEFESYLVAAKQIAHFPQRSSQVIFSFAVESREEVDTMLAKVEQYGGKVAQALQPNQWGKLTTYIQDPDGHLLEIVLLTDVNK